MTFYFQGYSRRECLLRLFTRSSFHIPDQGYYFASARKQVAAQTKAGDSTYLDRWRRVAQSNAGKNVTRWLRTRFDLNEFKLKFVTPLQGGVRPLSENRRCRRAESTLCGSYLLSAEVRTLYNVSQFPYTYSCGG